MKNSMKILVSAQQTLVDIVFELERLGYKPYQPSKLQQCAYTWDNGLYCLDSDFGDDSMYKYTTLGELREMKP